LAPLPDHRCGWRDEAERLAADLTKLRGEFDDLKAKFAELEHRFLGKKSEKMPPMDREVRKERGTDPEQTQRKRRENAEIKERVVTERIHHRVPDTQRTCPKCGRTDPRSMGQKEGTEYEYVTGYFRRRVHIRETVACRCGKHIVTAPVPDKAREKTRYGPGFYAYLIVAKCGDSLPFYRLEKAFKRIGIPIARSTMTDLFHRAAEILSPLCARILEIVAKSDVVHADETSFKMLSSEKKAYVWTFIGKDGEHDLIAYRFSASRSGETPLRVLGGTKGTLVVDMYTGYNRVTSVGGRDRAACLAHARRKIFLALEGVPEAQVALDLIRDVYVVEHEAKERQIAGTPEHRELRQARSKPLMEKLHAWLAERQDLHPPKSLMGKAIRYATKNWEALTKFLENPKLPPDNNVSEAALRVVALGRANYLFVENEDSGANVAGLYTLVATCQANGVNPLEYLRDVLVRIHSHPASRIDELLPHRWKPDLAAAA
jgi:transposase